MVEHLEAAVVRETVDHARAELWGRAGHLERLLRDIDIAQHFLVQRFAPWETVTRQHDLVRKRLIGPQRRTPAIEAELSEKWMRMMIHKVLHDDRARVGQGDRQRVFCLRFLQASQLKPDAIDDLVAFGNALIGASHGRGNILADLFVFLLRDAVSCCVDPLRDALQGVERDAKGRGAEDMIRVVVGDDQPRHRLPKVPGITDDFAGIRESVLSVDHEELRGKLDDMRIDEPAVFGRCESVDRSNVTACDRPAACHRKSPRSASLGTPTVEFRRAKPNQTSASETHTLVLSRPHPGGVDLGRGEFPTKCRE
jgi:hypothetical protein